MPVPEPPSDFGLWPAVKPRVGGWIETDEEAVRALGEQWTNAGKAFDAMLDGGGPIGSPPNSSWMDPAGQLWQRQILLVGSDLIARIAELGALGAFAAAFADDVLHAKLEVTRAIVENLDAYGALVTAPAGVDVAAQETFISEIARAINVFLDELAAQIAARRPGVAADGDRPSVSVDEDDLDGFGIEELADWAGTASPFLAAGALLFPPAAAVLAPLALATGLFALGQHTREAVADPSPSKWLTVAGDALGVAPGLGAASAAGKKALRALAETGSVPSGVYREIGGSVPALYDAAVATGLGVGGRVLPQMPTLTDLTTEGDQSEMVDAGNASKVTWRIIENLPR